MSPAELPSQSLTLKNGVVIPNRFAKSAMSEILGTMDNPVTSQGMVSSMLQACG